MDGNFNLPEFLRQNYILGRQKNLFGYQGKLSFEHKVITFQTKLVSCELFTRSDELRTLLSSNEISLREACR